MRYNSVAEYFAKLQNRSLIFFLSAVLVFSTLVYLLMTKILTPVMPDETGLLIASIICFFSLAEIVVAFSLTTVMLRRIKLLVSLGERLDKYATVNLVRFVLLVSGSVMLTIAFYLSGNQWIPVGNVAYFLFILLAWPTRSRVCAELKLKPSEREVIYGR